MDSKLVEDVEARIEFIKLALKHCGKCEDETCSACGFYETELGILKRCLESLRWIPVEERLPETLEEVWVKANGVIQKTVCRKTEGSWEYYDGEWNEIDDLQWPTHWLPIPQ